MLSCYQSTAGATSKVTDKWLIHGRSEPYYLVRIVLSFSQERADVRIKSQANMSYVHFSCLRRYHETEN